MWVVAIFAFLFLLLWVLGLSSFVPAPVLVIVFAALASGAAATLWFSSRRRRSEDPDAVIHPDTKI